MSLKNMLLKHTTQKYNRISKYRIVVRGERTAGRFLVREGG